MKPLHARPTSPHFEIWGAPHFAPLRSGDHGAGLRVSALPFVCVCWGGPLFRVMSAAWGDDDAEEWLEGVHGVGALECSCPDPIKELLLQGWKDGEWTQDDVQDQTTGFVASRDLEVWEAIIDEWCASRISRPRRRSRKPTANGSRSG